MHPQYTPYSQDVCTLAINTLASLPLSARGRRLAPTALRFPRLLLWLVVEVAKHYRLVREISVHRDMYEVAQELGISFNY